MTPAISVIVPLYNKAPFIQRALQSIAAQTHRDFEAIIVDDGSTDDSARIASEFTDSRFRVLSQPNAGPGAARNRGAREAEADWLAFLDADDEWDAAYLKESLELVNNTANPSAVASGSWEYPAATSNEPLWRSRGLGDGPFRLTPQTDPRLAIEALAFMHPPTTIVRAEVFRRAGGFYEHGCRYGEDAYLWLNVLLQETVAFQLKPLVRIHTDASGLSNNFVRQTPIEPFLTDPDPMVSACPTELRPLLASMLAIRAFKRACVLGYWGNPGAARSLRQRFIAPGSWKLPYYFPALAAGTSLAGFAGKIVRSLKQPAGANRETTPPPK